MRNYRSPASISQSVTGIKSFAGRDNTQRQYHILCLGSRLQMKEQKIRERAETFQQTTSFFAFSSFSNSAQYHFLSSPIKAWTDTDQCNWAPKYHIADAGSSISRQMNLENRICPNIFFSCPDLTGKTRQDCGCKWTLMKALGGNLLCSTGWSPHIAIATRELAQCEYSWHHGNGNGNTKTKQW